VTAAKTLPADDQSSAFSGAAALSSSLTALTGSSAQMNDQDPTFEDGGAGDDVSLDTQESTTPSEYDPEDDSMDEDLPVCDLYAETLREFDAALDDRAGWAWKDVDVATRLHDASTRLRNWKRSITWLTRGLGDESSRSKAEHADEDVDFQKSLGLVQHDNLYLYGVVWTYLDDVRESLENVHKSFEMPVGEAM
jgi:hypothetical protein